MASAESNQRRRAEEAPGAGLYDLMSLPSEIIDNILAQLPFDKLVRTLRRRWESVADLDIWFDPGSAAAPDARVLWRCAAPIHGFTARVRMRHFHRAARWLLALARKRVQKLVLRFDNPLVVHSPPVVGPALFSCRALTHLELYGDCYLLRAPPGFQGFPDLVTLVLHNVLLPFPGAAAQLQRLISSAPGLMELSLYDVNTYRFEICAIRAPSLRVLKLIMFLDNGCRIAEELPLLEEASISIDALVGIPAFVDTFRRISNVKTLFFRTDSQKIEGNPLEGISWKFQNLRVANLTANFGKLPSIRSIFSLLRFGPHIEKLYIEADIPFTLFEEIDDAIDQDILDAEISEDLFANLTYISLDGMKYLPNYTCFMKFLLSKTGLLESFVITFDYEEENESYVEACTELAACQKASPQAQLVLSLTENPA